MCQLKVVLVDKLELEVSFSLVDVDDCQSHQVLHYNLEVIELLNSEADLCRNQDRLAHLCQSNAITVELELVDPAEAISREEDENCLFIFAQAGRVLIAPLVVQVDFFRNFE